MGLHIQKDVSQINNIDDCVDTLCEIGTKLFPTSQDFEIWSFPKILGTTSEQYYGVKKNRLQKKLG